MSNEFLREFGELLEEPLRNGLTRPTRVRGAGIKMVNMGELFAYPRIGDIQMDRVPLSGEEAIKYLLRPGDLLFARQSLVLEGAGKCSIFLGSSAPVTFEGHIIRARLNNKIANPKYYFYYFNSPSGRAAITSIVEQVAAAGIRGSDLARLRVPNPPLPKQRAIAHILGALDDKIELNNRMNHTLESIARAIFKSWFIDFDPVHAKAEGRDTGLPPHLDKLFPNSFEDSELGEIPIGWNIFGLDQIANYLNGLALQKFPPIDNNVLPVIKISQLRKGHTEGSDLCSSELPPEYIVEDGDVIFSWSGSLEVVIWGGGRGALNQHLFKLTSDNYTKWFYYFWTKHHLKDFQGIAAGKATTMGHIQRHHLSEAKIVTASNPLLKEMNLVISPFIDRIINNLTQIQSLSTLRDTLLPTSSPASSASGMLSVFLGERSDGIRFIYRHLYHAWRSPAPVYGGWRFSPGATGAGN